MEEVPKNLGSAGSARLVLFGVVDVQPAMDRRPDVVAVHLSSAILALPDLHLFADRAVVRVTDIRDRFQPGTGRHRLAPSRPRHAAPRRWSSAARS